MKNQQSTKTLAIIAMILATVWFSFQQSFTYLHQLWLNNDDGYSHGYLVLAVSLYLILKKRTELTIAHTKFNLAMLVVSFMAISAWLAVDYLSIQALSSPLILAISIAIIGFLLGFQSFTHLLFPLSFVIFALPVWDILLPALQAITVFISQSILQMFEITALYQGHKVILPHGEVIIAQSCSGLRYLTTSLTLSTLFYYLNFRHAAVRGALMITTAIILALVANWFRVTSIIYFAYTSDMQSSLVYDHYDYGWYIYAISLVPFFLIANRLQPHLPNEEQTEKPISSTKSNDALLAGSIILSLAMLITPSQINKIIKNSAPAVVTEFPKTPIDWENTAHLYSTRWSPEISGYDSYHASHFINTDNQRSVRLEQYRYDTQDQGKELINDTNMVVNDNKWRSSLNQPAIINNTLTANNIRVRENQQQFIEVLYWYEVAGITTHNKLKAKLLELLALVSPKQSSNLWVLSTKCSTDCLKAKEDLTSFLNAL